MFALTKSKILSGKGQMMESLNRNSKSVNSDSSNSRQHSQEKSIDNLMCLTVTISIDRTIVDANEATVSELGYISKFQLTGKPLIETIYDSADYKKLNMLFESVDFEEEVAEEDVTLIGVEGNKIPARLNIDTITDKAGNPLCRVLTHIIFTDDKINKDAKDQAAGKDKKNEIQEENSDEQISLIEGIMEQSPFAISVTDIKGNVLRTNRKFRHLLDLADEQILGGYNIFNEKNLMENGVMPLVRSVYNEMKPVKFNIPYKSFPDSKEETKGQRIIWVHVYIYPVFGRNNVLKNVVFQWINITDNKPAPEKISRNKQILENIYKKGHAIVMR